MNSKNKKLVLTSGRTVAFSILVALLLIPGLSNETFGQTSCSGTILLQSFCGTIDDGSGPDEYPDNSDCNWLIQPNGPHTQMELEFSFFDIEEDFDFVYVYDGSNYSAPLIGTFTGTSLPPVITANSGSMLIRFLSDELLGAQGFEFSYRTNPLVNNTDDSGPGSLRDAVSNACDLVTVEFDPVLNGSSIQLSSGELVLENEITIQGLGANILTVDAMDSSRHFFNSPGNTATVSGLKLINGLAPSGGSIHNQGILNIEYCWMESNAAGSGIGGAVFNDGTSGGAAYLNINSSTFNNNFASGAGGAFFNQGTGSGYVYCEIVNSTVSSNSATLCGAMHAVSDSVQDAVLVIESSTITLNNSIVNLPPVLCYGNLDMRNTIVAGNLLGGEPTAEISSTGVLFSNNNLVGNGDACIGCFSGIGDTVGTTADPVDAMLQSLIINGGTTPTHAYNCGSPAWDAGNYSICTSDCDFDQSGQPRPFEIMDIGSYERQSGCEIVTVTFLLDLNAETISTEGVHIAGNFQGWNPAITSMGDSDGDGVYVYSTQFYEGDYIEYKFINGDDWGEEEIVPEACGTSSGLGIVNRYIQIPTIAESFSITEGPYCFASCSSCNVSCVLNNSINSGSYPFSTLNTISSGSSTCGNGDSLAIWFSYIPPYNGIANFNTCGSDFDTHLSIWSDCTGTEIACNNNSEFCVEDTLLSSVDLAVEEDVEYYIRVSGMTGQSGQGFINISDPLCNVDAKVTGRSAVPAPNGTNVNLSWNAIPNSDLFQAKGRKLGTSPFGQFITPNTFKNLGILTPETGYEWKMRAKCLDGSITAFSELDTFYTSSTPTKLIHQSEDKVEISLLPNPATVEVQLNVKSPLITKGSINILDINGKIIREFEISAGSNNIRLNVAELPNGVYTLHLVSGRINSAEKLIIMN